MYLSYPGNISHTVSFNVQNLDIKNIFYTISIIYLIYDENKNY